MAGKDRLGDFALFDFKLRNHGIMISVDACIHTGRRKKMQKDRIKMYKSIPLLIAAVVMIIALAACGSGGVKKGKEFTLGKNTYKLESASKSGGAVTVKLLVKGKNAPVIIKGFGSTGTPGPQMVSAVNMKLGEGDEAINVSTVKFDSIKMVKSFGVRMTFKFNVPSGREVPATATVINNSNKKETVKLDLASAGLKS